MEARSKCALPTYNQRPTMATECESLSPTTVAESHTTACNGFSTLSTPPRKTPVPDSASGFRAALFRSMAARSEFAAAQTATSQHNQREQYFQFSCRNARKSAASPKSLVSLL